MFQYLHSETCKRALEDPDIFDNFKRDKNFTPILEHVSMSQGLDYIKEIKKFDWKNFNWDKILKNDDLGNPQTYDYENQLSGIELKSYYISPTTLRYLCFGLKIMDYIKKIGKKELTIVEIGGGYGGQCKILFDLSEKMSINIKKYTIIDLEDVSKLQFKYLNTLNYTKIETLQYENFISKLETSYDLFIANYSLGEFPKNIQELYIKEVVSKCLNYFITWNTSPVNKYFENSDKQEEKPQTNPTKFKNIVITN